MSLVPPQPATTTFELSNGPDRPPLVHCLETASTKVAQYVVADPSTRRCVVINPARDDCTDPMTMSTNAADSIIALVIEHNYVVQHIFETHDVAGGYRSAAWYLRMQVAGLQGWPPEISSEATFSSMAEMWQKRHGAENKITISCAADMADGASMMIGRMRLRCMHLSGFGTPHQRALLVGGNLFGAHSLAMLSYQNWKADNSHGLGDLPDDEVIASTWRSMRSVMNLPVATRVYAHTQSGLGSSASFDSIDTCRRTNEYADLSEPEFILRWNGQLQSGLGKPGKASLFSRKRRKGATPS
ncbi:hypothetical protein LTR62_003585 [Meristemomyces frigidus]|uniref:Uncharacterized protein n=1 Tax=Meristemomyces frigidus TaxID=1508187 RepID=A0AAN7YGS5_9PEZI|nr:hypothetical protein LTR62_003585 [Meristemomyces frigidus]